MQTVVIVLFLDRHCGLTLEVVALAEYHRDYDFGMDGEPYWGTRSIAKSQAAGNDFVRLTCGGCGNITDYPIGLLLQWLGVTEQTYLGTLRAGSVDARSLSSACSRNPREHRPLPR